jgi:hypothetical protein
MTVLPLVIALVMIGALIVPTTVRAADAPEHEVGRWYPTLETGLTLTQSTYSDNWAGGDKGSLVWTFITNATLENQISESFHWNNTLKLAFGQTHQQTVGDDGERFWEKPEKSTDLVDFETLGRLTKGWVVDPFGSGRLETQFQDASDASGRNLSFNPIRIKLSAGVARQLLDQEQRSLLSRIGFTVRQTSRKLFTDPAPDETTITESTNDGGLEWVTDYKANILNKRVSWTSKLTVFQPVFVSAQDDFDAITELDLTANGIDADLADFITVVDVDWENIFTTQITKLLSVNLYLRLVYDKYDNSVPALLDDDGALTNPTGVKAAIRKALQIKETLALGITYRFL